MSHLFVHESPRHHPVAANSPSLPGNIFTLEREEGPHVWRLQVHGVSLDDLAEDLSRRPARLLPLLQAGPGQGSLAELSQGGVGRLLGNVGISQGSKTVGLVVDKVLGRRESRLDSTGLY